MSHPAATFVRKSSGAGVEFVSFTTVAWSPSGLNSHSSRPWMSPFHSSTFGGSRRVIRSVDGGVAVLVRIEPRDLDPTALLELNLGVAEPPDQLLGLRERARP